MYARGSRVRLPPQQLNAVEYIFSFEHRFYADMNDLHRSAFQGIAFDAGNHDVGGRGATNDFISFLSRARKMENQMKH